MTLCLLASGPEDYPLLNGATWRGYMLPPGGLESPEVLTMLVGWSARLQAAQGWGSWLAVEGGEVVASLAIKNPATEGTVEIGYAVAPQRRGRGIATRAVMALMPVLVRHDVALVRAETAVANLASGRVLAKAGFHWHADAISDDDGPVILWQRDLRPA